VTPLTLVRAGVVVAFALLGAGAGATVNVPLGLGALGGALAGGVAVALEAAAGRVPLPRLVWGVVGAVAGYIAGLALSGLVAPFSGGVAAPLLLVYAFAPVLGAWVGAAVGVRRAAELPGFAPRAGRTAERVLDTSVIIDGRVADLAAAGFLDGALVVPQFVVRELQRLADSGDAVRRNRGRRGFDILERLRACPTVSLTLLDADVPGVTEVDAKLVALARERGARLLTNDAALGRSAALAGVATASLHDLALALKPVALPGETMQVQVLREGKEVGQGVAYLDDGTMVVVEGGKRYLGQTLEVTVTSALQTSAGRMIFTKPRENGGA
jgi:uncharacterized protein YacL